MANWAVDMSNWSGKITLAQAQQMRAEGWDHAIVGLQNADIAQNQLDMLSAAGLTVDSYVYLLPDLSASDQIAVAMDKLGGRGVQKLWLDCEGENWPGPQESITLIQQAADACIGVVWTGIYTSRNWWITHTDNSEQFKDWALWLATADDVPDLSFTPFGGWTRLAMEQFAFDRPVAGVNCDLNVVSPPLVPVPPETPTDFVLGVQAGWQRAITLLQDNKP